VLHLLTREYYTLNETATHIWRLLENGASVEEIAFGFSQIFSIDPPAASDQVQVYLNELEAEGLVVVA
jgi:hypothetical protein